MTNAKCNMHIALCNMDFFMQNAKCNMHIALCILDFGKHVANMFFCRKKCFFGKQEPIILLM